MKRKLLAVLLAIVATVSLTVFGVTAFADDTPEVTYKHVSAVNMDTMWKAVGIQIGDSTHAGNQVDVSLSLIHI